MPADGDGAGGGAPNDATAYAKAFSDAMKEVARYVKGAGSTKLEPFKSLDPNEWQAWRDHFETICAMCKWDKKTARMKLAASVQGEAHLMIRHIDTAADGDAITGTVYPVKDLLDEYETCFVPESGTKYAHNEFLNAKQRDDEPLLQWHSRLRRIYMRAYPDRSATDAEADRGLVSKFIEGMADSKIVDRMGILDPTSYADALQAASSLVGHRVIVDRHQALHNKGNYRESSQVSFMGRGRGAGRGGRGRGRGLGRPAGGAPYPAGGGTRRPETRTCFRCGKAGHLRRNCKTSGDQLNPRNANISSIMAALDQQREVLAQLQGEGTTASENY